MLGLSERVKKISPSPTLAMDTKAKQLIAEGHDIINLSVGEPDINTPVKASFRAIEGIVNNFTKYTNVSGIPDLRKKLQQKLEEENGLSYDMDDIVVSVGGKHSLYNAFMALCNPNDEVILQAPYWVSYPEQIRLAEANPIIIQTDESTGFKITPEMLKQHITNNTKILLLNSPSNPTGAVYSRAELHALAEVIKEHEFYIISDEIYEKMVYGQEFVSILHVCPELKDRTLIVNGFSKTYGMTGWRLGYMAGPKEIMKSIAKFQSHVTANPTSIAQLAAIGALEDFDYSALAKYKERLDYSVNRLNKMKNVTCLTPQGAFYVFPNVSSLMGKRYKDEIIQDVNHLVELILIHAKVGIISGDGFGSPNNVRISYALPMERLIEAMDRLENFFSEI